MKVEHWNSEADGLLTEAAFRKKLESRGYRVSKYVYPPQTYFSPHTHSEDKIDAVLSGRFRIGMAGESQILEAGDAIIVPANAEHEAEVVGNAPVVSLDAMKIR
jgi:quercetin dioxygenase-like cupin family protein